MTALPSDLTAPDANDTSAYKGEMPLDVEFLPAALRRAGYATLGIGKWHLSPRYDTGQPGHNASFPLQRGFDSFYGFKMGWADQYRPELIDGNSSVATAWIEKENGRPVSRAAASFIADCRLSIANCLRRRPSACLR